MLVAWISRSRGSARVVERRGLHLFEQLLDHGADPHHLGGLLDKVGDRALPVVVGCRIGVEAREHFDVVVVGGSLSCDVHSLVFLFEHVVISRHFVDAGTAVVVDLGPRLRLV